jgi:hypothetical protein
MAYHAIGRRTFLSGAGGVVVVTGLRPAQILAQEAVPNSSGTEMQRRIRDIIHGYEEQGFHRTGTAVDEISADWLTGQVREIGLEPIREEWSLSRVDPIDASLIVNGRKIEGLPLFDGGFTTSAGIHGRLGNLNSLAPIGLTEAEPNAAAAGELGDARRQNKHEAIVVVTRGDRPGFCPSNAPSFLRPFGPPVLQVTSEEAPFLVDCARQHVDAVLTTHVQRTQAQAFNVTAVVSGSNRGIAPLVVMTPRSGWWSCASERGGGLACWLEIMRAMRDARPARDVLFVASSGHEIGFRGIEVFIEGRPGIVTAAKAWLHLGASIGAAQGPGNGLGASDDEMMEDGRGYGQRRTADRPADPTRQGTGRGRERTPRRWALCVDHRGERPLSQPEGSRAGGRRFEGDRTFRQRVCDAHKVARWCVTLTTGPANPAQLDAQAASWPGRRPDMTIQSERNIL